MPFIKPPPPPPPKAVRGEQLRERVLDAAERLLRRADADFSMRELAAEAGVSFATPFNQFGSKTAIMHALSAKRIDEMIRRFSASPLPSDVGGRVLLAVDVAVQVMLEDPQVNRAVMSWVGTAGPSPGRVLDHSTTLWITALREDDGFDRGGREGDRRILATHLAFAFRGVLSFWTAGELSDEELAPQARSVAEALVGTL
jgi:AcrR family transcriptional regulator